MFNLQSVTSLFDGLFAVQRARLSGKLKRTPTVLQMEGTECGAASLSIILQYYGKYVSLTELRELCGVSRDGSDAANILKAAQSLGLKTKGLKRGLKKLMETPTPVVLFWEFNHFLVLDGIVNDQVKLNDPAMGPRTVSLAEFESSYTGITLQFEPTSEFVADGKAPSIWPIIIRRLSTEKFAALFTLLLGVNLVAPQLIMPVFSQIYFDDILGNGFEGWLKPMLWAMACTIALQAILQRVQLSIRRLLEKRLTRRFVAEFQYKVLTLPQKFYDQRFSADIASRSYKNQKVSEFIASKFLPLFSGIILLVFYLVLTALYSWILGAIVVCTTGLSALVVLLNFRYLKDASCQISKDTGKVTAVVVNSVKQIETIKSAAIEQSIFTKFAGYQAKLLNFAQKLSLRNAQINLVPLMLTTLNEIAILSVGFWLVLAGEMTLGMLLAAQTIALNLRSEIEDVIKFFRELPRVQADILMLEDVLEQKSDPVLLESLAVDQLPSGSSRLTGKIEFQHVTFGYHPLKEPLISDFNLEIEPGQRIAFVGGSGSGKSTISKLVSGLYLPWRGQILYDSHSLVDIPRAIAVASIGMVQQDVILYGCSVRDNITLWDNTITQNVIYQACRDAQILDVILALPQGFDTILREGGASLSGGQRQRLELARVLAQRTSIIILDEATSALDAETERLVDQGLRRRCCTQIIVAHRLSTIRDADLIVVMENGSIVQSGKHEAMVRMIDSPYHRLISTTG